MSIYVVTERKSGKSIYRYSADAPVAWTGMEFATHDHTAEPEPEPDPEQPPPAPVKIEKLALRRRFTRAEMIAIEIASLDDPKLTRQEREASAEWRVIRADLEAGDEVDVTSKQFLTDLKKLEGAGLLAPGRAAEILKAETVAQEVDRG